jgi:hypothetical protein
VEPGDCGITQALLNGDTYRLTNTGTVPATYTATGQVLQPNGFIDVNVPAGGGEQCFEFECEC